MLSWGERNPSRTPLLPSTLLRRTGRSAANEGSTQLPPATASMSGTRIHLDLTTPATTRTSTSMGRAGLEMATVHGTAEPDPSITISVAWALNAPVLRRLPHVSIQNGSEGYGPAPARAAG